MQYAVRFLTLATLVTAAPALAQPQSPQVQERVVHFSLPHSIASKLNDILRAVPSGEGAYVYVAVQEAILAQGRAEEQAQIDAYNKGLIAQHEKNMKDHPLAPAAPPASPEFVPE